MARQRKTIPARGNNESLLIRSAESLGRLIGTLQRELEAARQFTARKDGADARGHSQAPARQRARGDAKQSTAKTDRVRSKQQRSRRAPKSAK